MRLVTKIKILLIAITILSLAIAHKTIRNIILDFLSENIPFIAYLNNQISSGTLVGVAFFIAYANVPILPSIPSEAYAIFAYVKGSNLFLLPVVATGVYVVFASIYYFVGYLFGPRIVEKMAGKKIKYSENFERFAGIILFLLYLFPIPVIGSLLPVLLLFVGAYKADYRKVIVIVALATFLRFMAVIILYEYYTPMIETYIAPVKTLLELS